MTFVCHFLLVFGNESFLLVFGNESCQLIRAVPPRAEASSSGNAALARCCVSYIIFGVFFQQLKHAPIWLISIMDAALKIIIGLFGSIR